LNKLSCDDLKLLTFCFRYADETGAVSGLLFVGLVKVYLGEEWQKTFIEKARKGGIEKVLL